MTRQAFILIGGSDKQNGDYSLLHRLAKSGRTARWSVLKGTRPGDRAFIYIQQPHSALIARADVLGQPVKGEPGDWPYRAKIGNVRILREPLSLHAMQRAFPTWAWLRYPRRGTTVPEAIEPRLKQLLQKPSAQRALKPPAESIEESMARVSRMMGAGFSAAAKNREVELAAVRHVKGQFKKAGYVVRSREKENLGYDLDATRGGRLIHHLEVKGIAGTLISFPISYQEVERARKDRRWSLAIVTGALTKPELHVVTAATFLRRFEHRPVTYVARPRRARSGSPRR